MATLEREEGDYTYWSDGAQRYAKGNGLGKAPGSLAKRHPKASTQFDKLTVSKRREISSLGGKAKYSQHKERVATAFAQSLLTHPDSKTEEDGLLMLAEAAFIQANDAEGGGAAVKAREHFIQEYTGGKQAATVVDARQIHITVSPEVKGRLGSMLELLSADVVDAEVREVEDDE